MVYHVGYGLWQIPQGGINAGEGLRGSMLRVVDEELGKSLTESIDINLEVIGADKMEFPDNKVKGKVVILESGEERQIKGKYYFFAIVKTSAANIDMTEGVYGVARWVDYAEAIKLVSSIYQKGKRRVTEAIVEKLKEVGAIS